jgi:hypothetical protein
MLGDGGQGSRPDKAGYRTGFPPLTSRGAPAEAHMSYSFLSRDYIPILKAASLLAFGDRDYETHYSPVEVWVDYVSPENAAEINRQRREDAEQAKRADAELAKRIGTEQAKRFRQYAPELFEELNEQGQSKTKELRYPEIERELLRLQKLAAAGEIKIYALRRRVPIQDEMRHPRLEQQYREIPAEFFQANEWTFSPTIPFEITKPFDRVTKTGGSYAGEWFYPAVALSDVQRLQAEGRIISRPCPKRIRAWLDAPRPSICS